MSKLPPFKDASVTCNIKILSSGRVGKSSFAHGCAGHDDFHYISTSGHHTEIYEHDLPHLASLIGSKNVKIKLDAYSGRVNPNYRGFHVFFILFDLCHRQSFEDAAKWYDEATRYCHKEFQVVLVGNKSDLADQPGGRVVFQKDIREIMDKVPFLYYYETYENNPGQREIFELVVAEIICSHYPSSSPYGWLKVIQQRKSILNNISQRIAAHLSTSNSTTATTSNQMDISLFKRVIFNRTFENDIWKYVKSIHKYLGVRTSGYSNYHFMCLYGYNNVLLDRMKKFGCNSIALTTLSPMFVNLVRYSHDITISKNAIMVAVEQTPMFPLSSDTLIDLADQCCINGNVELVKWFFKQYKASCSMFGFTVAVAAGNIPLITYILDKFVKLSQLQYKPLLLKYNTDYFGLDSTYVVYEILNGSFYLEYPDSTIISSVKSLSENEKQHLISISKYFNQDETTEFLESKLYPKSKSILGKIFSKK